MLIVFLGKGTCAPRTVAVLLLLGAFVLAGQSAPVKAQSSAEAAPIRANGVDAHYRINWLGAHIGDFRFKSSISQQRYELRATADVSVFFGAVTWRGTTVSSGTLTPRGPVPSNYSFRYRNGEKGEKVEMSFAHRSVREVSIDPPARLSSRRIPITESHLRNVVDPLSAVILLSQTYATRNGEQACNRRIPVFDGKLRYDLALSYKGKRNIGRDGNLRGTAYVCRVRYIPVAGHKPSKEENDYVTGNSGIEVWLVPLPEAGLMVPYYLSIPTPAGSASMISAKFKVDTGNGRS